ncbi:MAG: hypothetical protein J6U73_06170 [Alistipes sp.]|jgi:hypothetical protein|nr:hypothetical protein [Alistipes sp.]
MHYNEENTKERVRREVVILTDEQSHTSTHQEELNDEDEEEQRESHAPWLMITTGKILTEGSLPHHRYFIAIAVMCFFSIFLTYMSLNADREYRQREQYASVLHERAVLKEELRYSLSSKSAVTSRLKRHNIELIELSKDSRIIEK